MSLHLLFTLLISISRSLFLSSRTIQHTLYIFMFLQLTEFGRVGATGPSVHARVARETESDTGTVQGLSMEGKTVMERGWNLRTVALMSVQVSEYN